MYCSACGSVVPGGSSYCNRCGAKLNSVKKDRKDKRPALSPDGLVWALVSVLLGGIGLTMGFATFLKKELGFTQDLILLFTVVIFALVVAVSGTFLWLLVRGQRDEPEELPEDLGGRSTAAIGRSPVLELNAPPASIVEGTTRTLEPAAREPLDEKQSLDTSGRSRSEIQS
jgi:hypothetical protein